MSRLIAFVFAAALIASLAAAPATAQDRRYVGFTQELFDGTQGHFAPHEACREQFNAVWCTSQMIIEHGPHPKSFGPPDGGAWVNPAPVGFAFPIEFGALDFSGMFAQPVRFNCQRWSANFGSGLVVRSNPPGAGLGVSFATSACEDYRPAACCGGKPVQVFFPADDFDPPR